MRRSLRLFTGEEEVPLPVTPPPVPIKFGEFSEILGDAAKSRRAWLADFADDEVYLTPDLYEALVTYRQLRKGA